MTPGRDDWKAARDRAATEKAAAKASFSQLKAAVRPSAIAGRIGRKATRKATAASSSLVMTVRSHPVATAAVVTGAGLALASRPIGDFIAEEFVGEVKTGSEVPR